jgi:arylsulfatase A-like enzyme
MDIAPTALHALGLRQPSLWVGRPVLEIFSDNTSKAL